MIIISTTSCSNTINMATTDETPKYVKMTLKLLDLVRLVGEKQCNYDSTFMKDEKDWTALPLLKLPRLPWDRRDDDRRSMATLGDVEREYRLKNVQAFHGSMSSGLAWLELLPKSSPVRMSVLYHSHYDDPNYDSPLRNDYVGGEGDAMKEGMEKYAKWLYGECNYKRWDECAIPSTPYPVMAAILRHYGPEMRVEVFKQRDSWLNSGNRRGGHASDLACNTIGFRKLNRDHDYDDEAEFRQFDSRMVVLNRMLDVLEPPAADSSDKPHVKLHLMLFLHGNIAAGKSSVMESMQAASKKVVYHLTGNEECADKCVFYPVDEAWLQDDNGQLRRQAAPDIEFADIVTDMYTRLTDGRDRDSVMTYVAYEILHVLRYFNAWATKVDRLMNAADKGYLLCRDWDHRSVVIAVDRGPLDALAFLSYTIRDYICHIEGDGDKMSSGEAKIHSRLLTELYELVGKQYEKYHEKFQGSHANRVLGGTMHCFLSVDDDVLDERIASRAHSDMRVGGKAGRRLRVAEAKYHHNSGCFERATFRRQYEARVEYVVAMMRKRVERYHSHWCQRRGRGGRMDATALSEAPACTYFSDLEKDPGYVIYEKIDNKCGLRTPDEIAERILWRAVFRLASLSSPKSS